MACVPPRTLRRLGFKEELCRVLVRDLWLSDLGLFEASATQSSRWRWAAAKTATPTAQNVYSEMGTWPNTGHEWLSPRAMLTAMCRRAFISRALSQES